LIREDLQKQSCPLFSVRYAVLWISAEWHENKGFIGAIFTGVNGASGM
jgi:hypothetical protein